MNNLVILLGTNDSYTQQLKEKGYWLVSSDAIREDYSATSSENKLVFSISNSRILGYLSFGISVVFVTTDIDAEYLEQTIKELQANNGDTSISIVLMNNNNELAKELKYFSDTYGVEVRCNRD